VRFVGQRVFHISEWDISNDGRRVSPSRFALKLACFVPGSRFAYRLAMIRDRSLIVHRGACSILAVPRPRSVAPPAGRLPGSPGVRLPASRPSAPRHLSQYDRDGFRQAQFAGRGQILYLVALFDRRLKR